MKYKRIFSALTAFSLLLCGCQSIESFDENYITDSGAVQNPEAGSVVPAGEDVLTNIAKREDISRPEGADWLYWYMPTEEGFACIGGGPYDTKEMHVYHFHADTSDWSEMVLVPPAPYDGYYYAGGLVDFGKDAYYCLAVMENHSNMEPYRDGDEDYDWDTYNESFVSDYYVCTYTADGTMAGKVKIEGLEEYRSWQGYDQFSSFYCDGENTYLALQNGMVLSISADGALTETKPASELDDYTYPGFLRDRDGKPVFYESVQDPSVDYVLNITTLYEFDAKTGKIGEPFYTSGGSYVFGREMHSGGYGDYRLFVNEDEETTAGALAQKLYGIRDDGTREVVIDWDASDLEAINVIPLKDGTFVGMSDGLCRVTRRYASEIKEKQTISIGVLGTDAYIKDFSREFNRSQDNYTLQIVTYANSDGSYFGDPNGKNDALDVLKLAIVGKDAPDLVMMEGGSSDYGTPDYHDTFLRLGSRGVFCDLYEFMENDPEVNRDVLLPNVLTAMSHPNGALYSLTPGFSVRTIAVKSKFITKENWTLNDMIDLYEGADDIMYYWSTKQEMLRLLMTGTDFTDELSGTCSFDSPEFIKMLEFCDRYPLESNCPESNKDDPVQYEKHMKWLTDSYYRYQEDTDYLFFTGFSAFAGGGMASSWAYTKGDLGGDFSLVGYPSNNGKGGKIIAHGEIAILSTCSDKAAAWDVLKAYVRRPDAASDPEMAYSIFDDIIEEQLDNEMYIYEWHERTDAEYYDDDSRVYPLTQEERDRLDAYIRNCDTYMMLDEKVEAIVYEEAGMYFSGDRSAEDTAKMIQSRAELYLSEQSG